MGIPFGLYGSPPDYFNYRDPNIEMGKYTSYTELDEYKKAISLFSELPDKITLVQKEFVVEHLGLKESLNRGNVAVILYKSFLLWLLKSKNRQEFIAACFRKIKGLQIYFGNRLLDFSLRKLLAKIGFNHIGRQIPKLTEYNEIADFILSSDYKKIQEHPRFLSTKIQFSGEKLSIVDNASFLKMTKELFVKEIYNFSAKNKSPYIIDCGANIGLSVIYFKKIYPESKIIALEADPTIYQVLIENINIRNIRNVQCINSAVWINSETLSFAAEGSWGGYLSSEAVADQRNILVKALDLRQLIDRKIDLLKIDIEGAETEVLMHAKDLIVKYVDHLFFEWHSLTKEKQELGKILDYFSDHGFRYHIKEASERNTPFINKPTTRMDSQLDCFLYKI